MQVNPSQTTRDNADLLLIALCLTSLGVLCFEEYLPTVIDVANGIKERAKRARERMKERRRKREGPVEPEEPEEEFEFDELMLHPGLLGKVPVKEKTPGELLEEEFEAAGEDDDSLLKIIARQKREEEVENRREGLLELTSMAKFLEHKRGIRDMEKRVADMNKRLLQLQAEYPEAAKAIDPAILAAARVKRSVTMRKMPGAGGDMPGASRMVPPVDNGPVPTRAPRERKVGFGAQLEA